MLLPLLDDQPDILAPRAALLRRRAAARLDSAPLVASGGWSLAPSDAGWTVQIHDRPRDRVSQFGLSSRLLQVLRGLSPGERAPALDWFTETVLIDAGILVGTLNDGESDEDISRTACASFAADRYAVIPDALHPYEIAAIRRYLRNGIRTGAFPFGDRQVTRRYHAHNDPVLRVCQERLLPLVTRVVGTPVKSSYVYLSAYTQGSVLPPHRDRPQCEYSITLQVDYTPEPALETGWPIRLALPDAELSVYQSLGDALVYAGCQHVHFREVLPPGHTSTSLLLHYVDASFEGSLQ